MDLESDQGPSECDTCLKSRCSPNLNETENHSSSQVMWITSHTPSVVMLKWYCIRLLLKIKNIYTRPLYKQHKYTHNCSSSCSIFNSCPNIHDSNRRYRPAQASYNKVTKDTWRQDLRHSSFPAGLSGNFFLQIQGTFRARPVRRLPSGHKRSDLSSSSSSNNNNNNNNKNAR
jgi:hypothetical protein